MATLALVLLAAWLLLVACLRTLIQTRRTGDASAYCSRPGPRLVDGVEILAAALHPGRLPPPPAGTAVRLG